MNTAVEPSEAVGMSARRLERVGPAMQAYVDRGVYAGVNTLIARRGIIVHAGEFGWRDREAARRNLASTFIGNLRFVGFARPPLFRRSMAHCPAH